MIQILDLCNVRDDLRKSVHSAIGNYAERGLKSLAVARQVRKIVQSCNKFREEEEKKTKI